MKLFLKTLHYIAIDHEKVVWKYPVILPLKCNRWKCIRWVLVVVGCSFYYFPRKFLESIFIMRKSNRRALNKKKPSTFERGGSLLVLNKSSYHGDLYLLLQHWKVLLGKVHTVVIESFGLILAKSHHSLVQDLKHDVP